MYVTRIPDWLKLVECDKMGSVSKIRRCPKNKYGHNVQNIGSKMNQRLVIGYDLTLIRFGNDILKIVAVVYLFF